MIKKVAYIFFIFLGLYSCSSVKNIPDGQYLLNSVSIKSDNKKVSVVELEDYVRQNPNSSLPLLGKWRLGIYNMAGQDTAKWINRILQKMGQPPVLFSKSQAGVTINQLKKELQNKGYLNVEVDTTLAVKGKKLSLTYEIKTNEPYRVRNYTQAIDDPWIAQFLEDENRYKIRPGALFDKAFLSERREGISSSLRNRGYYGFSKDNLYYQADTTLNSNQVDLTLSLYPSLEKDGKYYRYKIRNVNVLSGYDPMNEDNDELFQNPDTIQYNGMNIVYGKNRFLRKSVISRSNYLKPGRGFSEFFYTYSYNRFSSIGAVKQTQINLKPVAPLANDTARYLDVDITIAPANTHWFQAGLEGTNSAGDFGIAPNVGYRHQNLFNGGEILSLKIKGAYELMSSAHGASLKDRSYYSYGGDAGLIFPQILFPWLGRKLQVSAPKTELVVGINSQKRPQYERRFFNAALIYGWASNMYKINHALNFMDINYISMPWASDEFKHDFLEGNPLLAATYQDQLIARTVYSISYTNKGVYSRQRTNNTYTMRASVDVGGWLPRLVTSLGGGGTNEKGLYEFVGVPFTEYVKVDLGFSNTRVIDRRNTVAYRLDLGVIQPYGNSEIMPFEKRYFGGGANNVRGWSTRSLGPGGYKRSTDNKIEYVNQVGDINFIASLEYRFKATSLFELATFVDAGNVWTIKDYEGQPLGQFEFSDFYKEIAVAYGVGLRMDLSFLLLRLDFGMKAHDPAQESKKFVMFKPSMSRDFAWHFAIGYPF